MTDKRTLGQGNVEVTLTNERGEEEVVTLKPSIHAMKSLSRKYGGLGPLSKKITELDFDTIVDVLEVGLQRMPSPKARQELESIVYHSGFTDSTAQLPALCIRFVNILAHGGRLPPAEQKPDDGPLANAAS